MNAEASNNPRDKRTAGYVGLSALLLVVVACTCGPLGNLGAGLPPTPTLITLDGGDTGSSSGSDDGTFDFVDADKASLSSYHTKFTMTYSGTKEDGTPTSGQYTWEQSYTSDPLASSVMWIGEGDAFASGNVGTFQMIQIGDTSYMITNEDGKEQCISMTSAGSGESNTPAYSPDSFFAGSDMSDARRVLPDEVVNGVLSQHWQLNNVDAAMMAAGWSSYTVDAWTAVDGGYGVRSLFKGDGDNIVTVGGKGHIEWEYNLLEANTDIKIDPPEGCEAGADVPMMSDATDTLSMGGFSGYTTASSIADVYAFYQAEMPAAGWTVGEENINTDITTLTFTKDDKTATITITSDDGKTQVMIQVE